MMDDILLTALSNPAIGWAMVAIGVAQTAAGVWLLWYLLRRYGVIGGANSC